MSLAKVFAPLAVKVATGAAVACLAACAVQTARIEGFLFVKGYKAQVNYLSNTINDLRVAKVTAEEKAKLQRAQTETQTKGFAQENDHDHQTLAVAGRAAVDRYAAANRVRYTQGSSGCGPAPATLPVPPAEHDRSGEAAELVAIPRQELDQLVEAALRAASNQALATTLIEAGLALPSETNLPEVSFATAAPVVEDK